jgi:hypothetical protein
MAFLVELVSVELSFGLVVVLSSCRLVELSHIRQTQLPWCLPTSNDIDDVKEILIHFLERGQVIKASRIEFCYISFIAPVIQCHA